MSEKADMHLVQDFIAQRGAIAIGHLEAKDLNIDLSKLSDSNKSQQAFAQLWLELGVANFSLPFAPISTHTHATVPRGRKAGQTSAAAFRRFSKERRLTATILPPSNSLHQCRRPRFV